jgi:hypothetical protein
VTGKSHNNLYGADGKCRVRRIVSGRTKTEARDKLKTLHRQLNTGCGVSILPACPPHGCLDPFRVEGNGEEPDVFLVHAGFDLSLHRIFEYVKH